MPNITFNELFNEYLQLIQPLQSEQTIKTKVSAYNKHFGQKYGRDIITSFKYKEWQLFFNELLSSGLKVKTVKNIKDMFQVMINTAIKMDYITTNYVSYVELPKYDNKRYFDFTDDEIKRFIKASLNFENDLYRGIFITLLHGRRLNEVLSLKWKDIDFTNKVYLIEFQNNKARRSMTYMMTDILHFNLINLYSKYQPNSNDFVFPSPVTNKKLKDIRRQWKKLLKKSKITKPMRIHDIRHLIGSYAVNSLGMSIEEVSFTLGHTSTQVTQRYVNPRAEISKRVIDNMFQGVSND